MKSWCWRGFDNVVRRLVLLSKQTFIATFVSRHVTTTNFSEPPLELSAGPRAASSRLKVQLVLIRKEMSLSGSGAGIGVGRRSEMVKSVFERKLETKKRSFNAITICKSK